MQNTEQTENFSVRYFGVLPKVVKMKENRVRMPAATCSGKDSASIWRRKESTYCTKGFASFRALAAVSQSP